MKILALDTSCDDTSTAVVDGLKVESNVISSQVRYHKKFGGVVPFLAQRLHKERIDSVVELALKRAEIDPLRLDAIAVTVGPGLAPALEVGIQKAKTLAEKWNLPIYRVNHMAGHLASSLTQVGSRVNQVEFPVLGLLVSGGHTELVYAKKWGDFKLLGQTLDDALGEAYDKLSKMLGMGYPGGPLIAKLAEKGEASRYELPIPLKYSKDYNFSYSGLKNASRLLIETLRAESPDGVLNRAQIEDLAASFEKVAQTAIVLKVEKVLHDYPECQYLLLGGGVAANTVLRRRLRVACKPFGVKLITPLHRFLCTDNAAMIGVAAYLDYLAGKKPDKISELDRKPGLLIG